MPYKGLPMVNVCAMYFNLGMQLKAFNKIGVASRSYYTSIGNSYHNCPTLTPMAPKASTVVETLRNASTVMLNCVMADPHMFVARHMV